MAELSFADSKDLANKIKSLRQYGWNETEKVQSPALIRASMKCRQLFCGLN